MEIEKISENGRLELKVVGRIDTVTAPVLDAEVQALAPEVKELVFDLKAVDYVSSAGLRVFLIAHKKLLAAGGAMKIANANDSVRNVFDITGFSSLLTLI